MFCLFSRASVARRELQGREKRAIINLVELNLKSGRALVVVAHPDDETIWMGGTIIANPKVNWIIFALCKKNDPDRSPRFNQVAKLFNAKGIMTDLEDDDDRLSIKSLSQMAEKLIIKGLKSKTFDYIFTHAKDGEYGNQRHKGVNQAVSKLLKNKNISAHSRYCFAYKMHSSDKYAQPKEKSDFLVKLSKNVYKKKIKIVNDFYGFELNSFESKSCARVEKFNKL